MNYLYQRSRLIIGIMAVVMLASCNINRNFMFKTEEDFVFDKPVTDSVGGEYRIGPNDALNMELYTNEGAVILQYTTSTVDRMGVSQAPPINFLVDNDGFVEFPVVGKINLKGKSINEAQKILEDQYSVQFNNPYCILTVINKRVLIFPGNGGDGQVVSLSNQNISVIEALALAGGIEPRGNASRVKLIRKLGEKQEVYLIDLSTIDGIKYSSMAVQSGDIIYVDPVPRLPNEVQRNVQPFFTLFTGFVLILTYLRR
jgi:polysaccharide biosynthesis/export protein